MLLSGCCLNNVENSKPIAISPIREAEFLLGENKVDQAVTLLREAIHADGHRCQAAFYLIFLDSDKAEYRTILEEQTCKSRYPYHKRILEAYTREKEKYKKCKQTVRSLKRQKRQCLIEKEKLRKEKEQVSFELKKLEQIRKETERLRLKK